MRLPSGAVSRARAMSRITISSSASAGIPGTPSRDDHSPSCMCPPAASDASSQCWARVTPRADAYSSARRMSRPSCTPGAVVGEQADAELGHLRHRRQLDAPPALGDGPRHPHVAHRRQRPAPAPPAPPTRSRWRARCWAWRPPPCTRPRAAARAPVSTVSASSRPGWRRWTWRSTSPGATTQPPASSTRAPAGTSRPSPTATTTRPSHGHVGPPRAGGVDHRPSSDQIDHLGRRSQQEEEDGHAHGDAVGHLAGDGGPGQVGHVGRDLDPPVHGAGVHDQGVVGQQPGPVAGSARSGRCTPAATGAAPPTGARPGCAAGRRCRPWAAPRRGRGSPPPATRPSEGGSSVGGATRVTSAPSMVNANTLERATRECLTSPTMAMRSPPAGPAPSGS